MYRREYNVSAWSVALEIAGYWRPGGATVRIYKDASRSTVQPWVVQVTHPTYRGTDWRVVANG